MSSFDRVIDRLGTHSRKWDMMESTFGIPKEAGLPMWLADMDFQSPECARNTLTKIANHGVLGYFGDDGAYLDSICWWMRTRHGWEIEPNDIYTTHGLKHGTALCIDAWSEPGDEVIVTSPVYHAFAQIIKSSGRIVVELPLKLDEQKYVMDLSHWDQMMTGREKIFLLCSPHNPGGRVWTKNELQGVADFCSRHDLILISDEIHHDLVYGGNKHIPMPLVDSSVQDRLAVMTSISKTFNLAAAHTGNIIVSDPDLQSRLNKRIKAHGITPNPIAQHLTTSVYSFGGSIWLEALILYLNENRILFDDGISAINGAFSMPLEATYLPWVSFSGTQLDQTEIERRIIQEAKVAPSIGATFGKGGESFLRYNIATPRTIVAEALQRIQKVFAT